MEGYRKTLMLDCIEVVAILSILFCLVQSGFRELSKKEIADLNIVEKYYTDDVKSGIRKLLAAQGINVKEDALTVSNEDSGGVYWYKDKTQEPLKNLGVDTEDFNLYVHVIDPSLEQGTTAGFDLKYDLDLEKKKVKITKVFGTQIDSRQYEAAEKGLDVNCPYLSSISSTLTAFLRIEDCFVKDDEFYFKTQSGWFGKYEILFESQYEDFVPGRDPYECIVENRYVIFKDTRNLG